jgi:flagellar basal-body rod protein FlgB
MDLTNMGLFKGLQEKMSWLIQRQGVIAQNVSNADTSDYVAKDLAPFTFSSVMKKLAPTVTDPAHIKLVSSSDSAEEKPLRNAYDVQPDGNAVSLEHEATKAAATAADYQLAANIYKSQYGMLKTATSAAGT